MDKISIIDLKIPARHGVYQSEKKKDEIFEIDVELYLDLRQAGKSDQLNDTVDYADVINLINNIFTFKDCQLIEAVGESICMELLKKYPIDKVLIRIRKPHAPIKAKFKTVEVELLRKC
tara:strand:+ start:439 stop:795 length:357 start_codon:yes stop_codon:yes gene_type:complete